MQPCGGCGPGSNPGRGVRFIMFASTFTMSIEWERDYWLGALYKPLSKPMPERVKERLLEFGEKLNEAMWERLKHLDEKRRDRAFKLFSRSLSFLVDRIVESGSIAMLPLLRREIASLIPHKPFRALLLMKFYGSLMALITSGEFINILPSIRKAVLNQPLSYWNSERLAFVEMWSKRLSSLLSKGEISMEEAHNLVNSFISALNKPDAWSIEVSLASLDVLPSLFKGLYR